MNLPSFDSTGFFSLTANRISLLNSLLVIPSGTFNLLGINCLYKCTKFNKFIFNIY